jgi:maltose/moltooligosaccharide transporter
MGLFNIFIVVPELVVSAVMGSLGSHLYPTHQVTSFVIAGIFMIAAAVATLRLERGPSEQPNAVIAVQDA